MLRAKICVPCSLLVCLKRPLPIIFVECCDDTLEKTFRIASLSLNTTKTNLYPSLGASFSRFKTLQLQLDLYLLIRLSLLPYLQSHFLHFLLSRFSRELRSLFSPLLIHYPSVPPFIPPYSPIGLRLQIALLRFSICY